MFRQMKCFCRFVIFLSTISWICADNSSILQDNSCLCEDNSLTVTIEQGKVRGKFSKSRNGTVYRSFLGVPFAKPPVGQLRFQSPQEPDKWTGVRNATVHSAICVQKDIFHSTASFAPVDGQEDCLYLDVYSPLNVDSQSQLPVIVHFHGGGFIIGMGFAYSPGYYMDHNMIIVTPNYRLGPFGFLSTADPVFPGNYGMKDQSAALRWVKKNIAAFGGNPELVTIAGDSSGAASVHMHMYSPLSKGLLQRGISQSGSAVSSWARSKPDIIRQKTHALGMLVGCPYESSLALLECLRTIPAEEIMLAHHKFYVWDFEPTIPFAVVPESILVEDAFIHDDFWMKPPINNVPWMTGITSGEGAIRVARYLSEDNDYLTDINKSYKRLFPMMLNFLDWLDYSESSQLAEDLKQFYFGDKAIGVETANNFTNMLTDGIFWYPCFKGLLHYQHTNSVYLYYYDHRNTESFASFYGNCSLDLGVSHTDELISLFPFVPYYDINVIDGVDLDVSTRMVERWINFARTGNPSTDDQIWHPFDANKVNYLHITSTHDEMKDGLLKDRLSFWKNAFHSSSDLLRNEKLKDEL